MPRWLTTCTDREATMCPLLCRPNGADQERRSYWRRLVWNQTKCYRDQYCKRGERPSPQPFALYLLTPHLWPHWHTLWSWIRLPQAGRAPCSPTSLVQGTGARRQSLVSALLLERRVENCGKFHYSSSGKRWGVADRSGEGKETFSWSAPTPCLLWLR